MNALIEHLAEFAIAAAAISLIIAALFHLQFLQMEWSA